MTKTKVTLFVVFVHIKSFCQRPCDQTDFMIPNRSLLLSLFYSSTVIITDINRLYEMPFQYLALKK